MEQSREKKLLTFLSGDFGGNRSPVDFGERRTDAAKLADVREQAPDLVQPQEGAHFGQIFCPDGSYSMDRASASKTAGRWTRAADVSTTLRRLQQLYLLSPEYYTSLNTHRMRKLAQKQKARCTNDYVFIHKIVNEFLSLCK